MGKFPRGPLYKIVKPAIVRESAGGQHGGSPEMGHTSSTETLPLARFEKRRDMKPKLKYLRVALVDLVIDPANARKHSPKNIEAIKGSLVKFGQQKPIVIDAKMMVIAGNGTVLGARELLWDHIDAAQTELVGAEAIAYAITDNRTSELAEWEWGVLSDELKALREDIDLTELGWEDFELDQMLGADWTPPDVDKDYESPDAKPALVISLDDDEAAEFGEAKKTLEEDLPGITDALVVVNLARRLKEGDL